MISISEGFSDDIDKLVIELDELGITIEMLYYGDGSIETDILYGDLKYEDVISKALYNGILLFLTSLLTNGYCSELLKDKDKLSLVLSDAFFKIPELSDIIKNQNI